jgi:signal transduction histidine kinase
MMARARALSLRWPGSLFARLVLAWLCALLVGHLISVASGHFQVLDYQVERTRYYLSKDLAILLPALEAGTPAERAAWLAKMQRKSYRYELGTGPEPGAATALAQPVTAAAPSTAALSPVLVGSRRNQEMVRDIERELAGAYSLGVAAGGSADDALRLRLKLRDGTPLTVHVARIDVPVSLWGGVIFALQMAAVIVFTWLAVRQATRPLERLVAAAEALGASMQGEPLAEDGPSEVARAAVAFNAMQRRITDHLAERVQILAAISHDLQTPITRMRLRADLMEQAPLREKLHGDLDLMQTLVEEGIAYARGAQRATEPACRVDVDALLDSLVCDYVDAGHPIALHGAVGRVLSTRAHTLRRIVVNLVDNALKFADEVEIRVSQPAPGRLAIAVLDRGPGIAPAELAAVLQPFYRIENSRNRGTGGTGLGLAIAQQLAVALEGTLSLSNRDGGGLEAAISLPVEVA